ncbi:hypothetical protein ABFS83_14G128400 [Erythranthe nasuta]
MAKCLNLTSLVKCVSLTGSSDFLYMSFFYSRLRSVKTDFNDGCTTIHNRVPKLPKESKPNLLLLHGFGTNAMW